MTDHTTQDDYQQMKLKELRLLRSGAVLLCAVSGVSKALQSCKISAHSLNNATSQIRRPAYIFNYTTGKTSMLQVQKYATCNNKLIIVISQHISQ